MSLVAALFLPACTSDSESPLSPSGASTFRLEDIATSASVDGSTGLLRRGAPPADGPGPVITASANPIVVNGGTMSVNVQGGSGFSKLFVYIGAKALGLVSEAQGGIPDYYEIPLGPGQDAATVLLTFPQEIPLSEFEVRLAAADDAGRVGPSVAVPAKVTLVGTGDVQVTLSWDANADVDLHVIDPAGEEIYYANRRSVSGGVLDLDSNAGCAIDGVRNENITWPVGRAPVGRYTVRVDYWDSCGVSRTSYTVRINAGGAPQLISGSFTGPGDQGGAGDGRTVATFERQVATPRVTFDLTTIEPRPGAVSRGSKPRPVQP